MRVLIASDSDSPRKDGVAVTVRRLVAGLPDHGITVEVLSPATPTLRSGPRITVADDYEVSLYRNVKVREAIRRSDVVHVFTPAGIGLRAKRIAAEERVPVVISYITDIHEYVQRIPAARASTWTFASKSVSRRLLGASRSIRNIDELLRTYLEGALVHFPTVAVEQRLVDALSHSAMRRVVVPLSTELSLRECSCEQVDRAAPIKVGYLGRIAEEKGLEFLMEAVARLRPCRAFELHLGGSGNRVRSLNRVARKLGIQESVKWRGEIERHEIADFMCSLDVFAFPSMSDTQGLVLQEAAMLGLPIAVRDPRLLWLQEYGLVHDVGTGVEEFADALTVLAGHSRRDVARNNFAGLRRLTEDSDLIHYLELYRRALRDDGRTSAC